MRSRAFLFGLLLVAVQTQAQQWKTYTTADGLAGNLVISVFQSRDGAMWFGTVFNGVSRYDRVPPRLL